MLDFIVGLLTFFEVVVALLLIVIILIQQSKAGGGLGAMSGAVTETFLGAGAGNVLTKLTVILATIFLCTTLLLAVITGQRRPGRSVLDDLPELEPATEQTQPAADGDTTDGTSTTDTDAAGATDTPGDADAAGATDATVVPDKPESPASPATD